MKKILIIEDNADIRENTTELLELNNYKVFSAPNGSTGFELAKQYQPDLILCDMMMPETDGREFLKLAKEDHTLCNVPLIFFSAGTVPQQLQKSLIKKADGYLQKPFSEEDLLAILSRYFTKVNVAAGPEPGNI